MWSGKTRPRRRSLDEEESASLVHHHSSPQWPTSSNRSLSPSSTAASGEQDVLEKGSIGGAAAYEGVGATGGASGVPTSSPLLRRWTLRQLVKLVILSLFVIVIALYWSGHLEDVLPRRRSSNGGRDERDVWAKFGNRQAVAVSTNKGDLPLCERTMLIDWRSFQYGFGSTATTVLHAGVVAKMHNYTLLFERGANKYGRYLDLFDPAPLDCHAPEELYDPAFYRKNDGTTAGIGQVINDEYTRPSIDRLLVGTDDIHPLNHHFQHLVYADMNNLLSLPDLDASKPVPVTTNVPQVFEETYLWYSALTSEHFKLNGLLEAKVNVELTRLGLDKVDREIAAIGVHWRGGDKLKHECASSSQLSCGNVTHHCITAIDSLPAAYASNPRLSLSATPRLLIMTTEPDAIDLFRNDEACKAFNIEALESDTEEKHSFQQDEWNRMSDSERAADVQSMFVGTEILANYVDTAIVSPNSNLGRVIFTRAGPKRVIERGLLRSVDIYWHPVHYPPFKPTPNWGGCDGTWGGCWPHD